MIRRSYDGWGYSPLDQITPANASRLEPAWVFSTGVSSGHEAAPLVNNGVMFFSTPSHRVVAVDARTGKPVWSVMTVGKDDRRFITGADGADQGVPGARCACWTSSERCSCFFFNSTMWEATDMQFSS